MDELLTVGHSSHALGDFVALLERHAVTAVADVRSAPYSRRHPHFGKEPLRKALVERGVEYVFLGRELGARSDDPGCYVDGQARYERIAATELFRSGLERVRKGCERFRLALMCAEAEPLSCHRTVLVCRALKHDLAISHILRDGALEPHTQTEERLLRLTGLSEGDLFRAREARLDEAYALHGRKIAYRRPD